MEDSQPLSTETFSYTWLVNRTPSLHSPNRSFRLSFDATDGTSFIEMDPNLTPSKRFLVHQDFDFNVPKSQSPTTLVHADKLLLNSIAVPLNSYRDSIHASPISSSTREEGRFRKSRSVSLHKCNRLPKTIIQKYTDLVRPLWCRMRRGRSDSSGEQGAGNRGPGSKSRGACWGGRSCDSESSIHEAVVHCKKTIGSKGPVDIVDRIESINMKKEKSNVLEVVAFSAWDVQGIMHDVETEGLVLAITYIRVFLFTPRPKLGFPLSSSERATSSASLSLFWFFILLSPLTPHSSDFFD
ncbi:hypothetical protein L1987_75083 [Smallanthus sonchifolius]|uniref:Uncharacterized protein n=1 Tax=Smallanthus sonchifolius TaxID=185202 RepID=A0ACB9A4H3_9ASTR|nr:hypothetical protein L1987_75083 [Smallanthus sonchifolius]